MLFDASSSSAVKAISMLKSLRCLFVTPLLSPGATDHPVAENLSAIAAVTTQDPEKGKETGSQEIPVTGGAVDHKTDNKVFLRIEFNGRGPGPQALQWSWWYSYITQCSAFDEVCFMRFASAAMLASPWESFPGMTPQKCYSVTGIV